METRLLRSRAEILAAIEQHAGAATSWTFCVAHANANSGRAEWWRIFKPHLPNLKHAVVGLELHQTEPWVLAELQRTGKLRVVNSTDGAFHPRLLAFESPSRFSAIVGGPDLAVGELDIVVEAAMLIRCRRNDQFEDAVHAFLAECLERARILTGAELLDYQRTHRKCQESISKLRERHLSITTDQFMRAGRAVLHGNLEIPKLEFLGEVASQLGHPRISPELRESLIEHLPLAEERGVILLSGSRVRRGTRTIADYSRQQIGEYILAVIEDDCLEREKVIQRVRRHLGFPKTSRLIRDHVKSAINSAIRSGRLVRDGNKRIYKAGT